MAGERAAARTYLVLKRSLDVTVAFTVLLLFSPLMAIAACAIRIGMGRPVLFYQERPGRNGEPFTILKFRTMRTGTGSDAERMTCVGKVIRSSSVDELPQLINVLRGEMSLVGPRPLLPQYLPLYDARQARRQEVLPGITGLAQTSGRNGLSWPERLELDAQYAEQCCFMLDLRILWRTVHKTAKREGVSAAGQATVVAFSEVSATLADRGAA